MERIGSILVVLSGGVMPGHAHARALAVARTDRAALTFVDVIDSDGAAPADAEIAVRRAHLAEAVAGAERAGLSATEAVVRGQPAVEVIRMVLREGHDLVAIAAGGADDTAARLVADCPCPVWLIAEARPEAVIAVVPPGAGEDGARVTGMARALAAQLGVEAREVTEAGMAGQAGAVVVLSGRDAAGAGAGSALVLKPAGFVSPVTLEAAPQEGTARRATGSAGKG